MRAPVTPDVFADHGLSAAAVAACASFAELPGVVSLAERAGARGHCFVVSTAFSCWLRAHRVSYRWVRATGPHSNLHRFLSRAELDGLQFVDQNATYVEDKVVVDWTWRMWQPESPTFPRVCDLHVWTRDFDRLEDETTCCPACGYRHMGPPGHASREDDEWVAEQLRDGRVPVLKVGNVTLRRRADAIVAELVELGVDMNALVPFARA